MSSNKPLVDRTEAVYKELRSMRIRFRLGAWITLIVGGLLLLLVIFYFSYGYSEVSSFRDPDLIVSLVGNMVDQQVPAMRKLAEDQVNDNASVWAEQASDKVVESMPQIREQIETLALQKSDDVIAQINVVGEKQFRRILDENRDTVQNAIEQLKGDEEISEGIVIALQEAIEKEFQIDADTQADALVAIVSDINANMEKLAAGENLSREQRAERRVLMLARRIHVDRFGDMDIKDVSDAIAIPAVSEIVQSAEEKQMKKEEAEAREQIVEVVKTEEKPAEKKEAPAEEKPAEESKEEAKPAAKPEEKKEAPAKEEAKPAEKAEEAAKEDKAAEKPEEKPADKPKEEAKPAEKDEAGPAKEEKPADSPEEKKKAS